LQPNRVARVGSISVFLSALLCTFLWSNATSTVSELEHPSISVVDHSLSGGSILACILFAIGIFFKYFLAQLLTFFNFSYFELDVGLETKRKGIPDWLFRLGIAAVQLQKQRPPNVQVIP